MESPSKDHYPVGVFHPNLWGDYFITHASTSSNELSQIQSKIDELKLNLSKMLKETTNHHQSLVLIDTMQHLGVAYHFEIEIDEILNRIHRTGFNPSEDMQTVALGFRLLRQHGLPASPDVFTKFLDQDGDLPNLGSTQSIEDLLGLYEASYFLTPDEKILEKAAYHARNHLELVVDDLNPYMKQMVSRALQMPRLKRAERLEARQFINVYELQQNRIEMLLEFAKLDFQCVQSLHHEELRHLSLWKNEHLRTETKFPFARDRVVESHFWMTGVYFEPCYSSARIFAAKILSLMSILDDIYDQRGTPEELQLFTETINRWELKNCDKLPEDLKQYFLILDNTLKESQEELKLEHKSFRIEYLRDEIKRLASAYHHESKWGCESFIPNVEDYLNISMRSSVLPVLFCVSYVKIKDVPREVFDWVTTFPEVTEASSRIGRIVNDLVSDEHEQKEKHVANVVQCYMRQHGCTKEVAHEKLKEIVEKLWRVFSQELLRLRNIPLSFFWIIINHARVCNLFYLNKDEYTNAGEDMKDYVNSVMVENVTSI